MMGKKLLALLLCGALLVTVLAACGAQRRRRYLRNRTANRWRQKRNQTLGTPLWTTPGIRMVSGRRNCWWSALAPAYKDSRRLTIGAIENAMEEAFPEYGGPAGLYQPDYH